MHSNNTFFFALDASISQSQTELDNNSFIYYDDIGQQGSRRALACHINSCEKSKREEVPQGHWYFPNGEVVPLKTQRNSYSVVAEQREGELLLQWFGHPSQTGRYFCKGSSGKPVFIHIGKSL